MEADVGFPLSRDDFSAKDEEDYEEDDRQDPWLDMWRGITRYILADRGEAGMRLTTKQLECVGSKGLDNLEQSSLLQRNMNTFEFVGDLRQASEISCVCHSETAENQFLKDPSKATLGDGFQPKDIAE